MRLYWAWNVSPEKYRATREGKLEPSVQDSGRPLLVASHSNEICDNGASDRFCSEETGGLRSTVTITMYYQLVSTSRLLRVAFVPFVVFCMANPYIALAVGLHNLFLLSTRKHQQHHTLFIATSPVFSHNLPTSGVFRSRSIPQGYP